jgi:hypothetical protein
MAQNRRLDNLTPAAIPRIASRELRHLPLNPLFEPTKLLIQLTVELQERPQRHDHSAGGRFVFEHHKPGLRGLTRHFDWPLYGIHLSKNGISLPT